MYRGVTLRVLEEKIDPSDEARVAALARATRLELLPHPERTVLLLDGRDVSGAIRGEEVARAVGPVARNGGVREELVRRQQAMGREGGVVMDGRDIGTVVFPEAQLKVYMTASAEERARRRAGEVEASGKKADYQAILADIRQRDHNDMTREVGPLKQAEDAVLMETDGMTIEQQVERVVELAREREEMHAKKAKKD